MHLLRVTAWTFAAALALGAGLASAQAYPVKPVRIILPYVPGGATAPRTILFAEWFSKSMGQNFFVDYRGGGDTIIGTDAVAKAAPDGYTLLAATKSIVVNHWVYPDRPYDTLRDLTPISILDDSNIAVIVNSSMPVNDLKEFIAYAKANPGKINTSSVSPINAMHNYLFMNSAGVKLTLVNYKGAGQVVADFLSGRVPFYLAGVAAVPPLLSSGKVKGLAITGSKRYALLPDVPTFAEVGMKDVDISNWLGLFAPGKTPGAIVQKMNAEVRKAQEAPEIIGALDKLGLVVAAPMSVAQAEAYLRTSIDRIGVLFKESGMKTGGDI